MPDDARRHELAPAKLNLFLHVGSRGTNGLHALESLVVFTAFGDQLRLAPSDGFALVRTGPYAAGLPEHPALELTARAVDGLARICGRSPDFTITLEKNIPVAAGLGGGSADAAAAIRLVCREWGIDPADARLPALAMELGADVPMCLYSRPAWIAGAGERVEPIPNCADLHLLLVNPHVPLSTAQVFAAYTPGDAGDAGAGIAGASVDLGTSDALGAFVELQRNDLAAPAQQLCPVIADMLERLADLHDCRLARMSGSGPTCFAVFDNADACARAARDLGAEHPDWWVRATRTRHPAE